VGERLPLACAAAAALAALLRELVRADEARALVAHLLSAHRRPPAGPGRMPALPLVLAAAAAWPQALLPSAAAPAPAGGAETAAADPSLAALHAGLRDACAAAVASADGSDGDEGGEQGGAGAATAPQGRCQAERWAAQADMAAGFVLQAVGPGWWGAEWAEG
jgi:hypothetical protein